MIDTSALKSSVDLRDLAARVTSLRRESRSEMSGPCPRCGGEDRFHVTESMAFCRQCWPLERRDPPHDAIGFVQWAGLARDFREAVEYLGGGGKSPITAAQQEKTRRWRDSAWQEAALRDLRQAQARLASAAGKPGADYLLHRGILPDTWAAWGLGYGEAWDPKLREARTAIWLPWRGRRYLTGIKFRFLEVPSGGLRYASRSGSECIAFGINLAGQHFSTLWLVEGELNAISIWQALRAEYAVNFDVLSIGSDAKASHLDPALVAWIRRYQQVIAWCDDPARTESIMHGLAGLPVLGLRSPTASGEKLDANRLLQAGALVDFLLRAWGEADKAIANWNWLREESFPKVEPLEVEV